MKAFIESQFGYCPLVWMFHSRSLNNKINRIHKRALRITYNDKSSSFQNLFEKDDSVTIHHRNIKILATETYKFLKGLSPPLTNEIFVERNNNYSLRGNNVTRRRVWEIWHWNSFHFSSKNIGHFTKGHKGFWISSYFLKKNKKMDSMVMPLQTL